MTIGYSSMNVIGYGQLTLSTSTATAMTSISGGIPADTLAALVTVEGAQCRARRDGTAPTSSVGVPYGVGGQINLSSKVQVEDASFIGTAAGSIINVEFLG